MIMRSTLDDFLTSVCYPHILETVEPTVSENTAVFIDRTSKL